MKWYQYSNETGEYTNPIRCQPHPIHKSQYLIPPHATSEQPPEVGVNQAAIFKNERWKVFEDHRGKTVYNKLDKTELKIETLGPIPETHTELKPDNFDVWTGTVWKTNYEAERQYQASLVFQQVQSERESHRLKGFPFKEYIIEARHSDQSNLIAIISGYSEGVMPSDTTVSWKVDTNTYLPLKGKQAAIELAAAMNNYVQALFAIEAMLDAEVAKMSTEQLKSYDVKAAFKYEADKLE